MSVHPVRFVDPLRWVWNSVRLPALALLLVLEPVVTLVCGGLALLGVLTTFFFKLVGFPHFPFWTMLALSLGFFLVRALYETILRAISR